MDQQTEQISGKKKNGCVCCTVGCGVPVCLGLAILFYIIYAIHDINREKFGENMATNPLFSTKFSAKKGSNYCYYLPASFPFPREYMEFTISEQDFLDWGKIQNDRGWDWKLLEIENLPSLATPANPDRKDKDAWPVINRRQGEKIPLSIVRYLHGKKEHNECKPWSDRCQIDPTGKTDNACYRLVDDGYYFEKTWPSGAHDYFLYDREKQRCYFESSSN